MSQQPAATVRSGAALVSTVPDSDQRCSDLVERFCRDALPLLDQLNVRARRLTHSTLDAEDLVQETLLRAFSKFNSYRDGTNVRAWLYTVMYNIWVGNYRAAQHRPSEQLTCEIRELDAAGRGIHGAMAAWRSAESEVLDAMPHGAVVDALQRLPAPAQTVIYLADVHGLPHKEIAELMSTSPATVASRLYRGREKLRELLTATELECQAPGSAPLLTEAVGDTPGA